MKKIGIDCRFASAHAGLGRYTREVVTHLLERNDPVAYKLFVRSEDEEWLADLSFRPAIQSAPFAHYSLDEQTKFPAVLRDSKIDLLFSPHFNVPVRCPVPFVVTVHDLILHRFPNNAPFLKRLAYDFVFRRNVQRARHIVSVSEFTKTELLESYPRLKNEDITVVSEAADQHFSPKSDEQISRMRNAYGLHLPYFLYVGNAKEHKNVQLLIDAFEDARLQDTELVLLTGGKEADALRLPNAVRFLRNVSDSDLSTLYAGALAFVTASAYEGFCLPVVEARASGCKVIASNVSAIPEAAQGNALLTDGSKESFTHAFHSLNAVPTPVPPDLSWEDSVSKIADILLEQV